MIKLEEEVQKMVDKIMEGDTTLTIEDIIKFIEENIKTNDTDEDR